MEKLHIKGGNKLYGTVKIGCAKNAYLPILAGAILCSGKVKLNNYPSYKDIINMTYILENLGAKKKLIDDCIELDMSDLKNYEIPSNLAMLTRSSIFSLGAILGRFKKARVAYPGGCDIGTRPIDLHLKGLR
ncbi:MAG: UDP-N-acetylglucosamine 1-carboxyvinyltransferase, partial [Clostridia bacterium]|nr:UDP-N-acetylglucosamine 1-carboxyvinyltransferase [Clostridia bacterium]